MHEVQPRGTGFVGELPDGWRIKPMSEACTKVTDGTHGTPETTETGRPYVTAIHVKGGKIDFGNCLHLSEKDHREIFNRCNPVFGDLAVVNIGAGVGECGFIDVDFEFSMKNVALLKPDPAVLDPRFLYNIHLFRKDRISHAVKSGGAQPFLSLRDLRKLPILLPPLPEQRKIADILSTWDAAIEKTEALLATAKTQKRALMQSLLTGRRRFLEFEGQPWKEVRLGEMGKTVSGGTPDSTIAAYWDGDIDWATPTDITKLNSRHIHGTARRITAEGLKKSSAKLVGEGALLICARATIGDLAIATGPICTNQGFKNLVLSKNYDPDFVFYLLQFFKNELVRYACGSTFLELSKKDFDKRSFHVPALEEQRQIAAVLNDAEGQIAEHAQSITKLRSEKKALMQQLLTGKRRVVV